MVASVRPGIAQTIAWGLYTGSRDSDSIAAYLSPGLAMGPGRIIAAAAVKEYRIPAKLLSVDPL